MSGPSGERVPEVRTQDGTRPSGAVDRLLHDQLNRRRDCRPQMFETGPRDDLLRFLLADVPTDCISMEVDEEGRNSEHWAAPSLPTRSIDKCGIGFGRYSLRNSQPRARRFTKPRCTHRIHPSGTKQWLRNTQLRKMLKGIRNVQKPHKRVPHSRTVHPGGGFCLRKTWPVVMKARCAPENRGRR